MGIISGLVSFGGRFADHFRLGDHFGGCTDRSIDFCILHVQMHVTNYFETFRDFYVSATQDAEETKSLNVNLKIVKLTLLL